MNRLASETSPYLRQHRDNPVDWYPWGDEAFAAARERDVPVLLSVGYASCHWCHVMAHECFEDDEVAARMNELFVNVKVDREERPDVDKLYMDAVQALTGRGGWPMTAFLTPDAAPFYGGTYFPRDTFLELLTAVDDVYRTKPGDVASNTARLLEAIDSTSGVTPADDLPSVEQLNATVQTLARAFDPEWGGFGQPPKFPSPANLELVLRAYMTSGADAARRILETTLDAMASGGMYDHLGGGFHRYSTDREWLVPHFEKMLYDQAQLVPIYLHALVVLRRPQWRQVVQETVDYVLRELRHPDGGFLSSQDADAPGPDGRPVEGLFHTWTPDEVRAALGRVQPDIVERTLEWWGITDEGNLPDGEGADRPGPPRSIPNRSAHRGELLRPRELEATRQMLHVVRSRRPRPATDDKVLLEWNALFLSALAQAGATFGHRPWLDAAVEAAEFLLRELRGDDGRWSRSWQADGEPRARHAALAADHAALVDAFTRLAEATGQARWIDEARAVADTMLDWFFDPVDGGLFTSAEDGEHLVVRQKDVTDHATPSASSLGALALYRLASLTGELRYRHQADRILHFLAPQLEGKVGLFSTALLATDVRRRGTTEIAIVGDDDHDVSDMVRVAHAVFRPDAVLAWGEPYDSPLWEGREPGRAYVCRDHVCDEPATTRDELIERLTGVKPRPAEPADAGSDDAGSDDDRTRPDDAETGAPDDGAT